VKALRKFLDNQKKYFTAGGKLEKLNPLYKATDDFLYTSGHVTSGTSHVKDAMDLKRMMIVVYVALLPSVFWAFYNTGYQALIAMQKAGLSSLGTWQGSFATWLGIGLNPQNVFSDIILGIIYFLPVYLVTIAVGGAWEALFASVRKHEIAEGFLVTSLLFPLILPPTIPLWQVAVGISFGVVIGKEIYGGVGMNILNPALVARAFLFFAYPGQISGDKVWVGIDGVSKATPLAQFADKAIPVTVDWWHAFVGLIPGSMGETSMIAILIGAVILIYTGVGSWKTMLSIIVGAVGMSLFFNLVGSSTNNMFGVTPLWHLVLGGFAFGTVFMATDPVSSPMTEKGKYYYGLLIGVLVILIRVVNPAFPEGMMLAILFGNITAPIIDKAVIYSNIKRRQLKNV